MKVGSSGWSPMEFTIVGSLAMRGPTGEVEPTGRLQRVRPGVLLARANESVAVDMLTDAMWDGRPDGRAPQRLQFHVHKLRRLLDDPARLSYGTGRFGELVGRGVAADSPVWRAELVRQALDLWRGRPFDGVDVPLLADEARRLGDRRMAAPEVLYQAEVAAVVVVAGTAGVGETALVVRWSHQSRDRFPDGQLYVDLRGYGPADPVAPEDALEGGA